MGVAFIVGSLAGLVYALIDIIRPDVATRWQVRSTRKTSSRTGAFAGSRAEVGGLFQRGLGIDPDGEPWLDPTVLRRVRWLGVFLAMLSACFLAMGIVLIRS